MSRLNLEGRLALRKTLGLGAPLGKPSAPPPPVGTTGQPIGLLLVLTKAS